MQQRFACNLEHLFAREFAAFGAFVPDEAALAAAPFPIVLAAGSLDRGTYYARPSAILAERLGLPWSEFPGYHLPFLQRPAEFAAAPRAVATQMLDRGQPIPSQWQTDTDG